MKNLFRWRKGTVSQGLGIPVGTIYPDVKKGVLRAARLVTRPLARRLQRRSLLRVFSPELVGHPEAVCACPLT